MCDPEQVTVLCSFARGQELAAAQTVSGANHAGPGARHSWPGPIVVKLLVALLAAARSPPHLTGAKEVAQSWNQRSEARAVGAAQFAAAGAVLVPAVQVCRRLGVKDRLLFVDRRAITIVIVAAA